MKTGLDMMDDIYNLVNKPNIQALIDGVVIKARRPKGSTKQDIVIRSLAMNTKPLQAGVVNVNIHCPNLQNVNFNGITDDQQPDYNSLRAICNELYPVLDAIWADTFNIDVADSPMLTQDSDGTWFMNIRVNYYAVINDFKNI